MSAARGPGRAAVDALRDEILNPATSPLALAVDVPFKAGCSVWSGPRCAGSSTSANAGLRAGTLSAARERGRRLAEAWAGRD